MAPPAPSAPARPDAPPNRRAVIEIGTNSVKLLVADVSEDAVHPVWDTSRQTRLGQGFYPAHRLQPGAVAETAATVAAFKSRALALGAGAMRVIATSAAREAENADELRAAVRTAAGLEVEIIPGDLEACWGFAGAMTDPALRARTVLLVDVGGGSTEWVLGCGPDIRFHASYPLGAVRLLEALAPADPPSTRDLDRGRREVARFLQTRVAPALGPDLAQCGSGEPEWVAVGGTATVLALMERGAERFDRDAVDGCRLTRAALEHRLQTLWSLPMAARRRLPGLPPERADVILTGALIYAEAMARFQAPALRVSARGVRYAAVREWAGAVGAAPASAGVIAPGQ